MVDEWVGHMFESQVVGVYYIDFCKAFSSSRSQSAVGKDESVRVPQGFLGWFASYLNDRKQCVKITQLYLTNSSLPRVFHKDQ